MSVGTELAIVISLVLVDIGVSVWALVRSHQTDRDLHVAIKHPVRLNGPVK